MTRRRQIVRTFIREWIGDEEILHVHVYQQYKNKTLKRNSISRHMV